MLILQVLQREQEQAKREGEEQDTSLGWCIRAQQQQQQPTNVTWSLK
jgi:hypothetical protein